MPDRDKLIKAWEIFRDSNPYQICEGKEFRAFKDPEYCMGQMIADTIDLLKEQEAKMDDLISRSALLAAYDKVHQGPPGGARKLIEEAPEAIVRCKECKHRSEEMYDYYNNPNDKRYVCQINDLAKKPDWHCADGERR